MSEEELGFDPTVRTAKGQRFIEIERAGTTERLLNSTLLTDEVWLLGQLVYTCQSHE
jgi:hypothetical protein